MFVERIEKQNGTKIYNISTSKDENNITRRVVICKAKELLKALQY